MAAPHVAGAFAIIKQAMPNLTVSAALSALQSGGLSVLDTRNGISKPRIRILNALLSSDTTAPDTSITGSPLAVTNLGTANFTFNSTESGSTFACKLDAGAFAACTSPKGYTNLVSGSHTFQVQATDPGGNTDPTPASFSWTIDLTSPATSITGGPTGTITVRSASFDWTGTDNVTTTPNLVYAYRLNPIEPNFSAFGSATTKSYTNLANGDYTFFVKAKDQAGNEDSTPDSRAFTLSGGGPISAVLTVSPTSISPGGSVTATWSGIVSASSRDWIGLYVPGQTNESFLEWIYVSCTKTPGSAVASGSCSFPIPSGLTPGNYELRLLANNGFTNVLAFSNPLTLTGATSLVASPATVAPGGAVIATWSGIVSPSSRDWIGVYIPGQPNTSYLEWIYVSCTKTPGSALASGSCQFAVPSGLPPGNYELRLLANDGFTNVLATSNPLSVTGATLTVNPGTVSPGGAVTATWSGIVSASSRDWIGLYIPGQANESFLEWIYVSCTKTPGSAVTLGSCPFPIPSGLPSGNYELRLLANDGFTTLATSNSLSVGFFP